MALLNGWSLIEYQMYWPSFIFSSSKSKEEYFGHIFEDMYVCVGPLQMRFRRVT